MSRPLCFVLLPNGTKLSPAGVQVDFDLVYRDLIAPAIENAGLQPLRAAQDYSDNINLKPLFEQFTLCPFAVADLTLANANLYHELGVRNAKRPGTTATVCCDERTADRQTLGAIAYSLAADGTPADIVSAQATLTRNLEEAHRTHKENPFSDRPIVDLLEEFQGIAHTKTDVFRERVRYSSELKQRLAAARQSGLAALRELEESFGADSDAGIGRCYRPLALLSRREGLARDDCFDGEDGASSG